MAIRPPERTQRIGTLIIPCPGDPDDLEVCVRIYSWSGWYWCRWQRPGASEDSTTRNRMLLEDAVRDAIRTIQAEDVP